MELCVLWWMLSTYIEVDKIQHPPIPTIVYIKTDKVKHKYLSVDRIF